MQIYGAATKAERRASAIERGTDVEGSMGDVPRRAWGSAKKIFATVSNVEPQGNMLPRVLGRKGGRALAAGNCEAAAGQR